MSGHPAWPGLRPRHTTHPAIWATAATVVLLAVGACSSTTTTVSPTTSAVAAVSPGSGGHRPTLIGAGSTFDAPFFAVAFTRYQQQHPGVTISYAVVGSSAGIAAISAQQVDFGAADVPMTAAEQAAAKGGPITQVPVDLGGEGIAYNLSLSAVSPAWAAKVGTGKTLNWPVGEGAEGNGSVASTDNSTPFSIGDIEQAYSVGLTLPFAAIRNQAGNYVTPSAQTVAADAAQKPAITPTDFSIVNQPGADSYPISGYSWALIYTHQPNQTRGQALIARLDWLSHAGQAYAAANGYVPLPADIRQLAATMLQQVTGPTGTQLLS